MAEYGLAVAVSLAGGRAGERFDVWFDADVGRK